MAGNNNNLTTGFSGFSSGLSQGTSGSTSLSGSLSLSVPPDNFDPLALQQSIIAHVRARQNVPIRETGANYSEVIMGWAEAIGAVQNPINSTFSANDTALFNALGNQGSGGSTSVPALLFDISGAVSVGTFVYQNGDNAASPSDSSLASAGPVLGVAIELPTATTVRVQNVGSYVFDSASTLPFLPMIPDTVYYADVAGGITSAPNPTSGGYIQEVGYAKTQYELVLNIQEVTLV